MMMTDAERAKLMGEHLKQWRIMLGLSQELVAARAGLSIPVVRRLEQGDTGVKLGSFIAVVDVLGLSERFTQFTDPFETDLGRLRSHHLHRQRAPRRSAS